MLRMRTPPAGRSALRPRSRGGICSPRMGLKSREMIRGRSPLQAMMSLTAMVRSKVSLQVTLTGRLFVTSPALGRIRSSRIAQAPSPLRMARVTICSSPQMALCLRSCVPTPSLYRQVLNCGGQPSESESEPLKHKGPGLLTALALPLLLALVHPSAWNRYSRKVISKIVHSFTPLPQKTRPGTLHSPAPIPLVTPMERSARSWMSFLQTNVCASERTPHAPSLMLQVAGRGYAELLRTLIRRSSSQNFPSTHSVEDLSPVLEEE